MSDTGLKAIGYHAGLRSTATSDDVVIEEIHQTLRQSRSFKAKTAAIKAAKRVLTPGVHQSRKLASLARLLISR